jgi:gluconolactonase
MPTRRTLLATLSSLPILAADQYTLGPDSQRQEGVPRGTVTKHSWTTSTIFPGTVRDYWIYVPAQYKPGTPAAVMVFQDGAAYYKEDGSWRVPVVFDNLIHRGEMPVTIGIFIDPGVLPARNESEQARFHRSFEYDAIGDAYSRFLLDEILPEIAKTYTLTTDPNLRAIAGASSGASCAFTAAWHRPDAFRRVLSFIGSYTNLRGADIYSSLVRKTEPKPLRVFLQDGEKDLDTYPGSWWIANQELAAALKYAGYDFKFVTGTEAHNGKHGAAILPDALRWLWRGFGQPIIPSKGGVDSDRQFSVQITDPSSGWELVGEGYKFTEGPAVDRQGNVFFTDIPNNRIHRAGVDGKVSVFKEDTGETNGLMFGADGRLYGCQTGRQRVVTWTMDGAESVVASDIRTNDIAVTSSGAMYVTDPSNKRVWYIDAKGSKRIVHEGIYFPNGVILSPDQSLLMVNDTFLRWVWSFQVQPDGSLANGQPFHRLEMMENKLSGADGMTADTEGFLYVATDLGIQVCDQTGRVCAILNKPSRAGISNVVFGGPQFDWLYVTATDKVFRRKMRRQGVVSWNRVTPPKPRL